MALLTPQQSRTDVMCLFHPQVENISILSAWRQVFISGQRVRGDKTGVSLSRFVFDMRPVCHCPNGHRGSS